MVPLELFRSRAVAILLAAGFSGMVGFYGTVFLQSLYFQQLRGESPLATGLLFLPMTGLVAALNPAAARVATRFGPRVPIVGGQLVMATGLVGLCLAPAHAPTLLIADLMIPVGVGGSFTVPPITALLLDSVPADRAGAASGVLNTSRQVGGSLGVAAFGAVVATQASFLHGLHVSYLTAAVLLTIMRRPARPSAESPADVRHYAKENQIMNLTLNNGVEMPALGFGVFQTPPDVTADAVHAALQTGYRLIDTAAAYGNERQVGEAIRRSGLARDEVFIETKVWISDYGYDQTLHAFDKSAGKLGADQIDLLILHQALPSRCDLTRDAYRALETLLADGRVRAIGVSNFMPAHLDALLEQATVIPAVNQVEVHPYFTQPAVQAADAAHGILTQAWSPIGGITSYRGTGTSTFDDPAITAIAAAHGKTPAQVMIRWHLQEGRSAIPKSVRAERIAENFDVFGFELTAEELKVLDTLDTGVRGGPEPDQITLENFGRPIPEA